MLTRRMILTMRDLINYCLERTNKTCLFFVPAHQDKSDIYNMIASSCGNVTTLNMNTATVTFDNGCKIILKTPDVKSDQLNGLSIDFFEEFGLVEYEVWRKLTDLVAHGN